MAHQKPIGEQMAALNTFDDTSFAADQSNGVLNATCPARIQNTSFGRNNVSLNESTASSSGGKWLKPKREALKITPLAQIDENPPVTRKYIAPRDKRSDYKTRLCDAFRRNGYCSYNNNCTYAHGDHELQMPNRRVPMEYSGRDSSRQRRESSDRRDSRERRESRDRRDSRSSRRGGDERDGDTSFSRKDSSSRYRNDDNWRPSSSSSRQICHAFQRGNCRFGPRCRYIHQEQMQQFNANATMFAAPSDSIAFYHHHQNTTQTYMMPYFIAPPQSTAPPQYIHDLNQSIPVYLSAPPPPQQMGTTYYCAPPPMSSQTPVMDQSMMIIDQSMMMGPATNAPMFPDFSQPPPQLMS